MTTTLIIALSFTTGFTICSILSWKIHRRHKQEWQDEYRRLMGGINDTINMLKCGKYTTAKHILRNTYNGVDR